MIEQFSVKNFKNFKNVLTLDFSRVRDYSFNEHLIRNGLINKMLLYGENNSGKSNLGAAMMDITSHLTENNTSNQLYLYYINGDTVDNFVEFEYKFLFGTKHVSYRYRKNPQQKLLIEELCQDEQTLFKYNYETNQYENSIPEAQTINLNQRNTDMSVLKYIYKNTMFWPEDSATKQLMEFVNGMLWFRGLRHNEFMGLMANGEDLQDFIINNHRISDFQAFLEACGQHYNLCTIDTLGKKVLGVQYKNYRADFNTVASTGTTSLWLFYYWMNRTSNISFVFLDEFDAFYHFDLSSYILEYINKRSDFQSVLTTHNTFLADNAIMRADCYSILKDGKITSFADSTKKVIRQGHNLEKMMLGGEFEQ